MKILGMGSVTGRGSVIPRLFYRNDPSYGPSLKALDLGINGQRLSGFGFQMNFRSALKILSLPVTFKISANPAYWNIPSCNNLFVSIAMRIWCPKRILHWGAFGEWWRD